MADNGIYRKGFHYNQNACIGCRACQIACCDKNDLDPETVFRVVRTFEVGEYPSARAYHYSATCNHCTSPACVSVCPNQAMYIDEADGTVQHDDSRCIGCQYCANACPYGVPQYIEKLQLVHKCDACIDLRANGEQPACVAICPMRALEFDDIDKLRAKYGNAVSDLPVLPDSSQTSPSVVIEPRPAALEPSYKQVIV